MGNRIAIEYKNVSKRFEGNTYDSVRNINLKIEEGTTVTILGTSGSGKTTLLKLTNRLFDITEGEIEYFGEPVGKLKLNEYRRKLGYVIQKDGLFPHRTVAENIATIPKILGWSKKEINERVVELMRLVQLDPEEYYDRYPRQLSGGQQQRVGIARALAARPSVMLMDEPFGAIDALTRANLQEELINLQEELGNTILFVTHDVHEAFKLGHKVIIMDHGEVQQYDTPYNITLHPANDFVRQLISTGDFYDKLRVLYIHNLIEPATEEELNTGVRIPKKQVISEVLERFLKTEEKLFIVEEPDGTPIGKITYEKVKQMIA